MLAMLALAGSGALGLSLWISVALVVLMIAVGLSYRQLIRAYPHGGGSYTVAARNLGELAALIAAGALMTEYVLTVAVDLRPRSRRSPRPSPACPTTQFRWASRRSRSC
jgi:amino acid transporter